MSPERKPRQSNWMIFRCFDDLDTSSDAYQKAQELVESGNLVASTFRFEYYGKPYVAILGEKAPSLENIEKLKDILASGTETDNLPEVIVSLLRRRRRLFLRSGLKFGERHSEE